MAGSSLCYDISHRHPDWSFLVQSYRIDTQDFDGRYVYASEFILFKKGEAIPSNFSSYPREAKIALWKVRFAVKRKFFEKVVPDIAGHFIKQPKSVADRFHFYATYLNLPNYIIDTTIQDIVYVATTPTAEEEDDFPEFFPYLFGAN